MIAIQEDVIKNASTSDGTFLIPGEPVEEFSHNFASAAEEVLPMLSSKDSDSFPHKKSNFLF